MESFDFNVFQFSCQVLLLVNLVISVLQTLSQAFRRAKEDSEFSYRAAIAGIFVGSAFMLVLYYGSGGLSIVVDLIKQIL